MNIADCGIPKSFGICQACGTRIAQKAIPFYCAKSSEMKVGVVPIYRFETPVCDECVKERTDRRIKRYWLISLAIAAFVGIGAFTVIWLTSSGDTSGTPFGRLFGTLFISAVPAAVILLFAAIISIQVCSSKFVAIQLAVKAKKADLDAAGFTGYWTAPPKNLTVRQY